MSKFKLQRVLLNALLLLAGFNAGNETATTTENPTVEGSLGALKIGESKTVEQEIALLKSQMTNMASENQAYKSQAGHWKAEAQRLKEGGLTKEELLAKKEEELIKGSRELIKTKLELHRTSLMSDVPKEFVPFISVIDSQDDFNLQETELQDKVKTKVEGLKAALVAYKASILAELKLPASKKLTTVGSKEQNSEVSDTVKNALTTFKEAKTTFNPWG